MDKPQAQGSLTCHFLVCKVFWDRGGGHSQAMVLLGILKESGEIRNEEKRRGHSYLLLGEGMHVPL